MYFKSSSLKRPFLKQSNYKPEGLQLIEEILKLQAF